MLIGGAVIIVLGAAAGLTLWLTGSSTPTGLVVTTQVVKVTTGTIKQTVATSGTIEPASQASLNFAVSGTVDCRQRQGRPDGDHGPGVGHRGYDGPPGGPRLGPGAAHLC